MKKFLSKFLIFILLISPLAFLLPVGISNADYQIVNINSKQEFITEMSKASNYDNSEVELVLNSNIDLAGEDLSSIYQEERIFKGVFNGNGYTISNPNFVSSTLNYGLFPSTYGATIKDLKIAGQINFEFPEENINEIYAGVVTGYAQNTIIKNCEIENTKINEEMQEEKTNITLNVFSDVNFGNFAGKIKGKDSKISNCVSYYDIDLTMQKDSNVYIGGIVGKSEQATIVNTLSCGQIDIENNLSSQSSKNQYLGGISGYTLGTNSIIKNSCLIGEINSGENSTTLNISKGAIIGGVSSSSNLTKDNINFDYWTAELNVIGSGLVLSGDKIAKVDVINERFLLQEEMFDLSLPKWDFGKTWILLNSTLHLQNFQTFSYSFNEILDTTQIFKSATFSVDGEESLREVEVKYGKTIEIDLKLKDNYFGFYSLSGVLLNSKNLTLDDPIKQYEVKNGNTVIGYKIPIKVNDQTDGVYSFTAEANLFNSIVKISDEAKEQNQGGVRSADANANALTQEMRLVFSYNASMKKVVAVGSGIYTFDYWDLYYYDEDGTTLIKVDNFDLKYNATLSITFGQVPFDRTFVLVANFSSENAIKVKFTQLDATKVNSITLNSEKYEGDYIVIPPKAIVPLEVVVKKDFVLNYNKLISDFVREYGQNTIALSTDPIQAEDGQTTYKFNINMRNVVNIIDKKIDMPINYVEKANSGSNNLTWLYIVIAIVVVGAIAGVIIFIVLRNRKGGGKGKGKTVKKQESKKDYSYNDYYI